MTMTITKEESLTIVEIAKRAEGMGLLLFDRMSLIMDLKKVHEKSPLRLKGLSDADEQNFTHDIVGIQNNFNRQTLELENFFSPRYTK